MIVELLFIEVSHDTVHSFSSTEGRIFIFFYDISFRLVADSCIFARIIWLISPS